MFALSGQGGEDAKALFQSLEANLAGAEKEILVGESAFLPAAVSGKLPTKYAKRARTILAAAVYRDHQYCSMRRGKLAAFNSSRRLSNIYIRYVRTRDPSPT